MYFTFKIDLLNKEKLNLGHSTPSKAKNSPFWGSQIVDKVNKMIGF